MLSALLDVTPASRRIAIVEDTPEIAVDAARHPGTLRLIASGDLDAHAAIRTALRTSPGRLVLGEVRDDAAYDFARAISHDRSGLATIHAASPQGALTRFATLAAGDPWCGSAQEAQDLAAGAIHLVVGLARVGGRRLVASVDEVLPRVTDGTFALAPIFRAEMLPGGEGQPEPRFAADPAWHMGARLRSVLVSARADADAVEAAVLAAA
jgi:Flp pilus assembly CpaF family ATPase